jgi:DNA repair protein RecN (Recombination protein N)
MQVRSCKLAVMLTAIQIRDLAVIQSLDLELASGLTVLSGETGAGKSILVDALGLALGDRGSGGVIRHGAERTEINVIFDIRDRDDVRRWLAAGELDADDECHLRRTIGSDGRSRGYINNRPVPMQSLRELGEMLVEIHGQHEHQSLIKRDHQRFLLDAYGGHLAQTRKTSTAFAAWREAKERLEQLSGDAAGRAERIDLLRYQIRELEALALAHGEMESLEERQTRLGHAETLLVAAQRALQQIDGDDDHALANALSKITAELESLRRIDPNIQSPVELFNTALIQLREGSDALQRYQSTIDLDPARLREVEERLGTALDLARKHRVQAEELPALLDTLRTELSDLEDAGGNLEGLQDRVKVLAEAYLKEARALTRKRTAAAKTLSTEVTGLMQELGIPAGSFEVQLDSRVDDFRASGLDAVEFLVTANPGHPAQALRKVASGGELSRISLAIQVAAIAADDSKALIFDEVDAGIGGGTAEIVGQKLRALGQNRQVLCVTHLAQVAAQGHAQVSVEKQVRNGTTSTAVRVLEDEARVGELARMLGGVEITEQSLAHAREMLERALQASPRRAVGS